MVMALTGVAVTPKTVLATISFEKDEGVEETVGEATTTLKLL